MTGAIWSDIDQRMVETTWLMSMGIDQRMGGATWSKSCPVPVKDQSMMRVIWSYIDRRMAEATWSSFCQVSRPVKDQ
ncbi:hypothetical protein DPMN_051933 [Dreissena polymorpha]|uniref:Uncharacterized protein n=1 Tax=Dreissena polymorpha TaxID=45954 RepID=A0A9D4CJI0_DREPO|nr:hypothetical protein DPMN_051933 [Dreissena polymorpha]